jgi:serine/threonine-protein kinase
MVGKKLGPYRIVRLLGQGGMGSVYLAEHDVLGRLAAVKVIDPKLLVHESVVERFLNEARLAARLHHPHLIPIYDIARDGESGPWFMALEYLSGKTLGQRLGEEPGPLEPMTIVHVVAQVASAIKHVHEHGAIHRDLKPENLFLLDQRNGISDFVVVLDLGVAHVSEEIAKTPLTKAGTLLGTPVYMAPEQLRGKPVTGAADVYALGVIAYVMATKTFPFQLPHESVGEYIGIHEGELAVRQRDMGAIDPLHRVPSLSGHFGAAIMRALDPDPEKRPSPTEYTRVLAEAVEGGMKIVRAVAPDLLGDARIESSTPTPHRATVIASASKADSRYELIERLGAGGMAEVFLARRIGEAGFEKRVAIKRVLPAYSSDPTFARLFSTEAQLASRLEHANLVSVFDFSRDAEGRLFLAMEFIRGCSLSALLESGPLTPSLIIYIASEMCRGLGYAHTVPDPTDPSGQRRGLVHRDIAPQNCLLSYEGDVKISDFGIAVAMTTGGEAKSSTVRGHVSYLSPEQANGEPLDGRSDLYSLGTLLYEMLTHQPLFVGSARETLAQILFKPIPLPSAVYSRVPADLEAIAMRLLARERADRYQTADEVHTALLACADAPRDGRGELAQLLAERFPTAETRKRSTGPDRSVPRGLVAQQIAVPVPVSTLGSTASQSLPNRPPSRSRIGAFMAIGAALGAIAAGVFVIVQRGNARAEHDPASRIAANPTPHDAPSPIVDAEPPAVALRVDAAAVTASTPTIDAPRAIDAAVAVIAHVAEPPKTPAHEPTHVHVTTTATAPPPIAGYGTLVILVHPHYADISVDGKPIAQTPFRDSHFAAGRHTLHLSNEDLPKEETLVITVMPNQTTTIDRSW